MVTYSSVTREWAVWSSRILVNGRAKHTPLLLPLLALLCIYCTGGASCPHKLSSAAEGTMAARPLAAAGGGQHSIHIHAAAANASGDDGLQQSAPDDTLNLFVRSVALVELSGNAFGLLAFTWATVVLLGGFSDSLDNRDLWFATIIIFIEAFRYVNVPCRRNCYFKIPMLYHLPFLSIFSWFLKDSIGLRGVEFGLIAQSNFSWKSNSYYVH